MDVFIKACVVSFGTATYIFFGQSQKALLYFTYSRSFQLLEYCMFINLL